MSVLQALTSIMTFRFAVVPAAAIVAGLLMTSYFMAADAEGRALSFSLLSGAAFGIVLQRGRFCFLCNFRDLFERRRSDGVIAILIALGAGAILYQIVITAWMPVPLEGRLPPTAHVGPAGSILALAALVFGMGMALSGSCLSAHFYRLGEGAFGSLAAIGGAGVGFLLGFITWPALYTVMMFDDPPLWLPHHLGYAGSLISTITALLLLGLIAAKIAPMTSRSQNWETTSSSLLQTIFSFRWPPVVTGILIATISAVAYFRVAPLGVTAELGSIVRTAGTRLAILPTGLPGLDTLRGCISAVKEGVVSPNGVFVCGLVLASFSSALIAGQFKPSWPPLRGLFMRIIGGIMMGWSSMIALGCTVGVLLSGIHAGAASGWIFLVFCTIGAWAGLAATRSLAARKSGL